MKINRKILSIPPYISTTWKHIVSIQTEGGVLVISLMDGSKVEIPELEQDIIENIFNTHVHFIEKLANDPPKVAAQGGETRLANPLSHMANLFNSDGATSFPIRLGPEGMEGLEELSASMQHNPAQKDMPDLPPEVLSKIGTVAKALGAEEGISFPKAEPHCNCIHCQIARAIHNVFVVEEEEEEVLDEEVSEDDLTFREWDITETSDKLYTVANPLDSKEKYSVYLGNPVGCTCGDKDCVHIKAVLRS